MPHALITGGAGFIGSHLADQLLAEDWDVTVVDNYDPFYERAAKERNIARHSGNKRHRVLELDIRDLRGLRRDLTGSYQVMIHLAAKAGVRPSIEDPLAYEDVNIRGTHNLLEFAKERGIRQFVFASSSSVYGMNPLTPWSEDDLHLRPISPYASTKLSCELLGHVYSHLYGIRFLALRFFTVYGPRQRPDLAIHKFARLMMNGEPIPVFGDGSMARDYTFYADIVQGIRAAMEYNASAYEIFNLGNNRTITLMELIRGLESVLSVRARIQFKSEQPGDVLRTWASIKKAEALLGYSPQVNFIEGLEQFAEWLRTEQPAAEGRTVQAAAF
jgi:UDP-glucuronate 4-epimerase